MERTQPEWMDLRALQPAPSKQELFVREYRVDRNATRAAKAAGYSKKTAYSIGQRLLKNVEVAKRLAEVTEQRLAKLSRIEERA